MLVVSSTGGATERQLPAWRRDARIETFQVAQAPEADKCKELCPGADCPTSCRRDGPARGDRRIEPIARDKESPKKRDGPARGDPKAAAPPKAVVPKE